MMQLHKLSEEQGRLVKMLMVLDFGGVSLRSITNPRWVQMQLRTIDRIDKSSERPAPQVGGVSCEVRVAAVPRLSGRGAFSHLYH